MARTGRASAEDYTHLVGSPQYGGASGATLKDEDGGRRGERERERERERAGARSFDRNFFVVILFLSSFLRRSRSLVSSSTTTSREQRLPPPPQPLPAPPRPRRHDRGVLYFARACPPCLSRPITAVVPRHRVRAVQRDGQHRRRAARAVRAVRVVRDGPQQLHDGPGRPPDAAREPVHLRQNVKKRRRQLLDK